MAAVLVRDVLYPATPIVLLEIEKHPSTDDLALIRVREGLLQAFPGLELCRTLGAAGHCDRLCVHGRRVVVPVSLWSRPEQDPSELDSLAEQAMRVGPLVLCLTDHCSQSLVKSAFEVTTRCQRFLPARNQHGRSPFFERLLKAHRRLHDLSKPLVKADYEHALDTWIWVLRLAPSASLAVQVAALFHDVERLISESERRIEQFAPDYLVFKQSHAATGAELTCEVLKKIGAPRRLMERVAQLIATHEQPSTDAEAQLLNEADALSFFSLNASGFLDYYGLEHTARKVLYTLKRFGQRARRIFPTIRHCPMIASLVKSADEEFHPIGQVQFGSG